MKMWSFCFESDRKKEQFRYAPAIVRPIGMDELWRDKQGFQHIYAFPFSFKAQYTFSGFKGKSLSLTPTAS